MIFAPAAFHLEQRKGVDKGIAEFNLPREKALSEINIEAYATNGASGNATNPLSTCITQIELLHPFSQAVYDLSADMLQLVAHIDNGRVPYSSEANTTDLVQRVELPVRFGRYPGDPVYFMPGALTNETILRVHYDLETVRACGATGFVSGSLGFRLNLLWAMDRGRGNPAGTRSLVQQRDITTSVTSGVRQQMPPQNPPLGVYVYAYKAATAEGALVDEATISTGEGGQELSKLPWLTTQRSQIDLDGSTVGYMIYCPTADQGQPMTPATPYSRETLEIAANQLVAGGTLRYIKNVSMPPDKIR